MIKTTPDYRSLLYESSTPTVLEPPTVNTAVCKTTIFAVGTLALIAVGAGMKLKSTHDVSPITTVAPETVTGGLESTGSEGSATQMKARGSPQPSRDETLSGSKEPLENPPGFDRQFATPTTNTRQTENHTKALPPIESDSLEADSVVGSKFAVSASVEAHCERLRQQVPANEIECADTKRFLSDMAQEPRDAIWAPKAEAALTKLLLAEPGKYTIRNIECRTSICVVEYSATVNQTLLPSSEFEDANGLREEIRMFAHESDPSGNELVVTVLPFARRR